MSAQLSARSGGWPSFAQRIVRAAKLDVHLYEEVEADTGAMRQAMAVVALSSVAAGSARRIPAARLVSAKLNSANGPGADRANYRGYGRGILGTCLFS